MKHVPLIRREACCFENYLLINRTSLALGLAPPCLPLLTSSLPMGSGHTSPAPADSRSEEPTRVSSAVTAWDPLPADVAAWCSAAKGSSVPAQAKRCP